MKEIVDRYATTMVESALTLPELADRDRDSPTYGCFSYMYWRSKSLDYANARFQEAAYTLALLYRNQYPGNRLRGLAPVGELVRAALRFWCGIQHPDGSFDEWYRNEHGFAATAFSAFAISRAYLLLKSELGEEEHDGLLAAFRKSARWLCRRDDLSKINHEAVAAAALYSLAEALKDKSLFAAAGEKVRRVLDRQTPEGWFPELGGLDTGYSFLTWEYLSLCRSFSRDQALPVALERALEFLSHFVHPDLTTGREYNLCGNSYVSLLGSAVLSEYCPLARSLFREGVSRGNGLVQLAQDDLSRCYHLYIGLLAYDHFRVRPEIFSAEAPLLPFARPPFRRYFPGCRMSVVRTERYYAIASGNHGGLLKVYSFPQQSPERDLSCHDLGYTIEAEGARLHSGRMGMNGEVTVSPEGDLEVTVPFRSAAYFFPSIFSRLMLSLLSAVPLGYRLIKLVTDYFREKKKSSFQLSAVSGTAAGWTLRRRITFGGPEVAVTDLVSGREGALEGRLRADLEIRSGGFPVEYPLAAAGRGGDGPRIPRRGLELAKRIRPQPTRIEVEYDAPAPDR